jgi:hypothetical protein
MKKRKKKQQKCVQNNNNNTNLVIPLKQLPRLTYNPCQHQLSDLRQLGIDNNHKRSKHRRKLATASWQPGLS